MWDAENQQERQEAITKSAKRTMLVKNKKAIQKAAMEKHENLIRISEGREKIKDLRLFTRPPLAYSLEVVWK